MHATGDSFLIFRALADIKQSFSRYRTDVGDCLINAYYVLREPMLEGLVRHAMDDLGGLAQNDRSPQALEATLFCISAIHEAVPMDEDTAATQLFTGPLIQTLTSLTGRRFHGLQKTALHLIGEATPFSCFTRIARACADLSFCRGVCSMVQAQQPSLAARSAVHRRLSEPSPHFASRSISSFCLV